MKDNKLFLKIYVLLLIIFSIAIIVLSILGKKTRVGYLGDFKFDDFHIIRTLELNNLSHIKDQFIDVEGELDKESIKNYIFTNESIINYSYGFKVQYYDKVFRHSDIYGVYIDTNKILEDNGFIKEISTDGNGSPFGNLISSKKIDFDKIDNVYYTLSIRKMIIIYYVYIFIIILLFIPAFNLIKSNSNVVKNNIVNNTKDKKIYISLLIILIFAIFIRIYWTTQKGEMHEDEYHTIAFANYGYYAQLNEKYYNKLGIDIIRDLTFNDSSILDCISDIERMHKNTNDPFLSNLYYSLVRLLFIGRTVSSTYEIKICTTILNIVFFLISYIFLYKILNIFFLHKKHIILVSMLIMSLSPVSISYTMFLRPYQMQEAFFILLLYIVISAIKYNKFSMKNLLMTIIVSGIGYITLYSSLLFVLVLSFFLFINYCLSFNNNMNRIQLINIKDYRIIFYYAFSFFAALLVSNILYGDFFDSLLNTGSRSSSSIEFDLKIFNYINIYSFNNMFYIILILNIILYFYLKHKSRVNIKEIDGILFIVIIGLLYLILAYIFGNPRYVRYFGTGFITVLFLFPIFFYLIDKFENRILSFFICILISIIYIYNITNTSKIIEFNKNYKYNLSDNIPVLYNKINYFDNINTNLYYTTINLEKDITKITNDKFYLIQNTSNIMQLSNYTIEYIFNNEKINVLKYIKNISNKNEYY